MRIFTRKLLVLFLISMGLMALPAHATNLKNCDEVLVGDAENDNYDPNSVTDTEREKELGYGWFEQELVYVLPHRLAKELHELKFYELDYGPVALFRELEIFIRREFVSEYREQLTPNQTYALFKLTAEVATNFMHSEEELLYRILARLAHAASHSRAKDYRLLTSEQQHNIRTFIETQVKEYEIEEDYMQATLKLLPQFGPATPSPTPSTGN